MKKSIIQNFQNYVILPILLISIITTCFFYFYKNHEWKKTPIESIEIQLNKPFWDAYPYIYTYHSKGIKFDYSNVIKGEILNASTFKYVLPPQQPLRKLRIYFDKKIDSLSIKNIKFNTQNSSYNINLSQLKSGNNLKIIQKNLNNYIISLPSGIGYLQTPNIYFYPSDLPSLSMSISIIITLLTFLFFFIKKQRFFIEKKIKLPDLSVIIFLFSIFLPHPFFNITLLISILMVIKNFKPKVFFANKINLIFISYFLIQFLNDLFIAPSGFHNLKATETLLPFLILPIYISCINNQKLLIYFPVTAFFMGLYFFLTSIFDTVIFTNFNYFSFNEFTKHIHPVYFSYLISFSIFYILLQTNFKNSIKNILQIILFFFLILAGSKMIISFTILIYLILSLKNKTTIIILSISLIFLSFFPPIQNRFKKILNLKDLNIIHKKHITNKNEKQINGLTLRLILWQESLNTIKSLPNFVFGLGVDDTPRKALADKLIKRGLEKHQKFSAHNQYINTFVRSGLIGLIVLLGLLAYLVYIAIKNKNKLLLITVALLFFAMLTESVLQRIVGIYFFTTVLLFLIKPDNKNENRHNWNKRNP